jgi:hypothetical protein
MNDIPWNAVGAFFTGAFMASLAAWMMVVILRTGSFWTRRFWNWPWRHPSSRRVHRNKNPI